MPKTTAALAMELPVPVQPPPDAPLVVLAVPEGAEPVDVEEVVGRATEDAGEVAVAFPAVELPVDGGVHPSTL